jgi:hypothetical protein
MNGEKLAELTDGRSPIFIKARWFTEAPFVSTESRGKLCGLKKYLSQRKRPGSLEDFRRRLGNCSSLVCVAELCANLVDGDDLPALGVNRDTIQFLAYFVFHTVQTS